MENQEYLYQDIISKITPWNVTLFNTYNNSFPIVSHPFFYSFMPASQIAIIIRIFESWNSPHRIFSLYIYIYINLFLVKLKRNKIHIIQKLKFKNKIYIYFFKYTIHARMIHQVLNQILGQWIRNPNSRLPIFRGNVQDPASWQAKTR